MTNTQFQALCGEHLIDPAIALENDNLVAALYARDDAKVAQILTEEF